MEEDIFAEIVRDIQQINETDWGPWKLDRATRTVYEDPHGYSLRIDDLLNDGELARTLIHLAEKTWVDNEYLGGLIRASMEIRQATGDPIHKKG